jgi:hypothetical protein
MQRQQLGPSALQYATRSIFMYTLNSPPDFHIPSDAM